MVPTVSAATARRLRNVTERVWGRCRCFNCLTGYGRVKRNGLKTVQIALIFVILLADRTMYDAYRRAGDRGKPRGRTGGVSR